MRRRILPEAAYDFWAEDSRDGERLPIRDTLSEARKDAAERRASLEFWRRCVISVEREVNERKVLRLLKAAGGK